MNKTACVRKLYLYAHGLKTRTSLPIPLKSVFSSPTLQKYLGKGDILHYAIRRVVCFFVGASPLSFSLETLPHRPQASAKENNNVGRMLENTTRK